MKNITILLLFLLSTGANYSHAMEIPGAPNFGFAQALGIQAQDIDFSGSVTPLPQTVNPALLGLVTVSSDQSKGEKLSPTKCLAQEAHPFELKIPSAAQNRTLSTNGRGIKKFACGYPDCSASFATMDDLKQHILPHLKLKPYECPAQNCTLSSAQRNNIKRHMAKYHADQPGLQIPEITKEDKKKIKNAIAVYLPQLAVKRARLKCQTDGVNQSTASKKDLYKKRPADAAFAVSATAGDSTDRTTPQKKYPCGYPDCSQTAESISHLEKHIYTHLNLKLYRCPATNCDLSCAQKGNLTKHMARVHTDQQVLQIPELSKETRQEIAEKVAPYLPPVAPVCQMCNRVFETEQDFNSHNRRLHNNPLEMALITQWNN
ncbi:hypothetical protein BH09DEP1_BH09DEP1_2180 [soil metagenome]